MAIEMRINPFLMIAAAIIGAAISYFSVIELDIIFTGGLESNILLITLAAFVLAMMFFGYLSIPLMFVFGFAVAPNFHQHPALVLQLLPILLAGYGGGLAGTYIQHDINNLFNFYSEKASIIGLLVGGLIVAILLSAIQTYVLV